MNVKDPFKFRSLHIVKKKDLFGGKDDVEVRQEKSLVEVQVTRLAMILST